MPDAVVILRPPLPVQDAAAQPAMPVESTQPLERTMTACAVAGALAVRRDTLLAATTALKSLLCCHGHQPVTSDTATPRSRIRSSR